VCLLQISIEEEVDMMMDDTFFIMASWCRGNKSSSGRGQYVGSHWAGESVAGYVIRNSHGRSSSGMCRRSIVPGGFVWSGSWIRVIQLEVAT